ncbi:MAG TPA: potassium transporter Kup [Thermoanaerobaculia bacterium]|nr:potassium transporter Kup [Thermoanaerobaculia bacterium]
MGHPGERTSTRYLLVLSLGALGVVYGDIGTSPLYALRECFHPHHGVAPTPDNVIGILSLILWSLTIVISFKYLVFVMRADNRGEGGILALMSLVRARGDSSSQARLFLVALGLFGAALLYGDGMITPAISVLSAIEGIDVATPLFGPYIVPVTIVVLIILFIVQRAGTARVGAMFGPVMLVWFAVIASLGVMQIVREPHVLVAINPAHAFNFFVRNRIHGFLVLGAVFLCVTGGEALYADMGHFGARPIRLAWFILVFPCLLLNYFGQGALLLQNPAAAEHPFFHMAPAWARLPLVGLATLATIIASQAVISGAFSLTRQAVQLGYAPRLDIRHTSEREIGQIYIASVNWALMICAIGLVIAFRSSSALAAAYGVAVTTTMGITTALLAVVERERWRWGLPAMLALTIPLLIIDLSFFGANIVKVAEGGWFPLAVGIFIFTLLATWRRGREILAMRLAEGVIPIDLLVKEAARGTLPRVRGTAIFLSRYPNGVPPTLLHNIKHNKILHEQVILLTVTYEETSHLGAVERHQWQDLGYGIYRLQVRFGFMEETNIPAFLTSMKDAPIPIDLAGISFFLGRETLIATRRPGMALWREKLFSWMIRNASSATQWFGLPTNQVIELGSQIEI